MNDPGNDNTHRARDHLLVIANPAPQEVMPSPHPLPSSSGRSLTPIARPNFHIGLPTKAPTRVPKEEQPMKKLSLLTVVLVIASIVVGCTVPATAVPQGCSRRPNKPRPARPAGARTSRSSSSPAVLPAASSPTTSTTAPSRPRPTSARTCSTSSRTGIPRR